MKKLRSKKGFTLTEMLIAVMLLGFVSAMVAVMTTGVLNATVTMQEVAQAEVLGNEALENIQSELRFATNIVFTKDTAADGGKGSVTFHRQSTNIDGCSFGVDETGKIVVKFMGTSEEGEKSELLFGGTSYGNLTVSKLSFSLPDEEPAFSLPGKDPGTEEQFKKTIEIAVSIAYGQKVLWSGGISVRPLAGSVKIVESGG